MCDVALQSEARPHERVRRYRFGALHRCCSSDSGAKKKTSDNLLQRPFQRTDRATQWSFVRASHVLFGASAGATSARQ
jgi:hypothetical protein